MSSTRGRHQRGGKKSYRGKSRGKGGGMGGDAKKGVGTTLYSGLGGFPASARVRLSYPDKFSITTTVASVTQVFRGNGPFDPDYTSTGAQPINWDDWALRYNRYKVMASSVTTKAMTLAASTLAQVCIYPSNATSSLSIEECEALPWAKFYMVNNAVQLKHHMSMKSPVIDGSLPRQFMGRESVDAQVTTVPADQWFWHIVQASHDSSTSCVVYYETVIIYDILFYDRVDPRVDLAERLKTLRESRLVKPNEKCERKGKAVTMVAPGKFGVSKFKELDISIKNVTVENKGEGTQALKMAQDVAAPENDDEDKFSQFLEFLKTKKARSALRQAHAFEECDFSGTRPLLTGLQ